MNKKQHDDEILYRLKADIEQQNRKYPNSKDKVKEILRKFKTDYPKLILSIKSQNNLRNKSSEVTLETSSEKGMHMNHIGSKEPESIEEQNSLSSESLIQETTTSKDNEWVNRNEGHILPTDNFKGDDIRGEDDHHITSVKLSTELLNTVAEQRKHVDREISLYNENEVVESPILASYNCSAHSDKEDMLLSLKSRDTLKYDLIDDLGNSIDATIVDKHLDEKIDCLMTLKEKASMEIAKSIEHNPDVADELTQVIGEYYISSSTTSENNSITSTDADLLQETVKEIHNDLGNFIMNENIILTPPCDFRDT